MVKKWIKQLQNLSPKEESIMFGIINKIVNGDFSDLDIKKLQWYDDMYRCRIGKYRIIFKNNNGSYEIRWLGPRGDVYK